jgi:RNA polymerase sigma-70 factor (ECF subfamily)
VDRSELAELLPAEVPGLMGYATSLVRDPHLAEDLVGDTLVRALERSASYRGDARLGTWLHRILHNLAVDRARSAREVPAEDIAIKVEDQWRADNYTVDLDVVVARAETRAELRDALIRLPYIYRSAVLLHDAEGMTVREVAEISEVALPAAKQRLRRGRMMLVSALAEGAERRESLRGVPLSCWTARSRVSDYMDDELESSARRAVEGHLAACPTCPALYHSLVAARTALGQGGGLPADFRLERDSDAVIPPVIAARLREDAPDR